jgi:hypothetical protein
MFMIIHNALSSLPATSWLLLSSHMFPQTLVTAVPLSAQDAESQHASVVYTIKAISVSHFVLHNMSTSQDNIEPTSVARFRGLWSLGRLVSMVTTLQAGQLRFHFCQGQRFFFSPLLPSGPIQPLSGPLPSSAEVKNVWSYTSADLYIFMAWCLIKIGS